MNEDSTQQIAACRKELALLKSQILAQLSHWRALPKAIRQALVYATRVAQSEETSEVERRAAEQVLRMLGKYETHSTEITINEARKVRDGTLELLKISKKLPNWEKAGSLWNELHSTVQQHMESAARGFDEVQSKTDELIREVRQISTDDNSRTADSLSHAAEVFRSTQPDMTALLRLLEGIEVALGDLPSIREESTLRRTIPLHTKRFLLAIIEDNAEWQQFVLRSVEGVRQQLGASFSVETRIFSNVQDAVAELVDAKKEVLPSEDDDATPMQVIAIADMGLPADQNEMLLIEKGKTTPSRSNGHELLHRLRSYRANIPVIILTTPAYLLEDQLHACAQGIQDYNYILKGPDREERLVEAILRIIHQAQSHRIDLWLFPKYEARVDGIPIPLTDMPFRTLYALSLLSSRSRKSGYSLENTLDQLDETFRDEYDYKRPPETAIERSLVLARQRSGNWWSAAAATQIANVMRLWAARKAESRGNIESALEHLRKENFQVWKDGLSLLDSFRNANPGQELWARLKTSPVQRFDARTLSLSFEACFGGIEIDERPDYDLHNLEEHVNLIREGIHSAFKQLHRHIEARTEVLVRRMAGDDYGYRLLGQIVFHDEPEEARDSDDVESSFGLSANGNTPEDQIRVLVVENEQQYYCRIEPLLRDAGFDVRVATNQEDALLEALAFQPEILSLDLHIPATREEFESNPSSGSANAGIRVLKETRKEIPNIRVMIPTTLFDNDDLREVAVQLGVPATDFVPKGESLDGAAWEGHMLLTASRFRQELRTKATLPALPSWRFPIIRILDGTDLKTGRLNLLINGKEYRVKQSNQGRLLSILLQASGNAVSYADIDSYVQTKPGRVGDNKRKQWLKNLRKDIRSEWLRLSDESSARPELEILEAVEGGLILHAHVEALGLQIAA